MKQIFKGFHAPTEAEYADLWSKGLFVLDTNVLLDFYRLPLNAQDEFWSALDKLKDRLWLPHQVGLEYQRRRLSVILEQKKKLTELIARLRSSANKIEADINELEIEKRALGLDPAALLTKFRAVIQEMVEA